MKLVSNRTARFLISTTMIACGLPASLAWAQTGDGASNADRYGGPEIVVTATRRSESVLSVPLSITAVTAEALERKAAQNFFDYATSVPNLSFGVSGYGVTSARTIGIRGIADEGTTALYLDDTPVPESLDPKVINLDRIEVLRGPQGTLYGARSMGGAVRLITAQPDPDGFSARAHGQVSGTSGAGKANSQFDGMVNIPLADDKAALRLVGIHTYDAGFIKRQFPTAGGSQTVSNVGANKTIGGSAAMLIKLGDNFSVTPRILYQRTTYKGFPYVDVAVADPFVSTLLKPQSLTVQREFDLPEFARDRFLLGTFDMKLDTDLGTFTSSTSYFDRKVRNVEDDTLAVNQLLGFGDANGFPTVPVVFDDREKTRSFTQEVRFSSDFEGPFQIIAGAFYTKNRATTLFPPLIIDGIGPTGGPDNLFSRDQVNKFREIAGYAEGTLTITDGLSVIAGLRAFSNRSSFAASIDGVANGGLTVIPRQTLKQSGVTPKLSLQYKFNSDMQVYATAAKGYRPGGGQPPITAPACGGELAALGLTPDDTATFGADNVWSYEAGAKGALLDRRLTFSAAAFRVDWKDIQQTENLVCGFPFRTNAGSARSQGVELEMTARPAEGWSIDLGFGYTDAKFRSGGDLSVFRSGDRVPQVPRYTLSVGTDYSHALTDQVEGFLHADYQYVGGSTTAVNAVRNPITDELVRRIRPSYELLNLRAGLTFDRYEVAVFGRNVTNEIASLSDVTNIGIEAVGRARVAINRPRTIGLEMSAKF